GLVRRLNDVQHTLVGTNFVLIARVLVDVRGNQHCVPLLAGRQRNRTTHLSPSTLRGFHDFLGRFIDQAMVKCLQPNADLLVLHFDLRLQFAIPNGRTTPVKRRRNCTDAPGGCQSLISQTKRAPKGALFAKAHRLLDDLGHHAGANGATAFADGEAQTFFHGDRSDQGDGHLDVVARHHHLHAFRQLDVTGHVGGTEVELRTVALEERGMTTTFFLAQHVHFAFELGVRLDGARLGQNLTALHVFTLGAAQQHANVLTSTAFVQQLAEHFHAGAGGLDGRTDTDDFHFFLHRDDAALDTTGRLGTATGDLEHVFDRHQERLVDGTLRLRNVVVQGLDQLSHGRSTDFGLVAFQGLQGRTHDDRGVVAREVVGVQQVANFHLDQFQQLGV